MKQLLSSATGTRRDFLRNSMLLAVPVVIGSGLLPKAASASVYAPPARQRGATVRSVRDYGAYGDGLHDDTAAIQRAISALPADGGTVFVPAGTYLVDALKSVKLRSYMMLQLDPGAVLKAKPNSSEQYNVVLVDSCTNVEIAGGQIMGERDQHVGTTGEGGHCLRVRGSQHVTVRDIRLSKGWGDGMTVGPKPRYQQHYLYSQDVAVANIVCTENRRNGLSIGNVIGIQVWDSEFSYTNGTAPQCGIDIEPDKDIDGNGYCDQVLISNCAMSHNARYGVNVWKRARNVTITGCSIDSNQTCGIVTTGLNGIKFSNNQVHDNQSTGMYIKDGTNGLTIADNTFYRNYLKQGAVVRTAFYLTGTSSKTKKDLIVGTGTSSITVSQNYYR